MSGAEHDRMNAFGEDESKRKEWAGFVRMMGDAGGAPSLAEVVGLVGEFLEPVLAARAGAPGSRWPVGGPWTSAAAGVVGDPQDSSAEPNSP